MAGNCGDCLLWSPLHHEPLLDESVCGRTVSTVTAREHSCRYWKKDILAHMRSRMAEREKETETEATRRGVRDLADDR